MFFRQFLKFPLTTGSVCPSGRALSSSLARMALEMQSPYPCLMVDLGAGTGVVTRELLNLGVAPEAILAIDISREFQGVFNRLCAPVTLCVADAKNLYSLISRRCPDRGGIAIISSLPLRNMGRGEIRPIMRGIRSILLERGGCLLQYTYALWIRASLAPYGFSLCARHYIMRNIPPALVEKYDVENKEFSY